MSRIAIPTARAGASVPAASMAAAERHHQAAVVERAGERIAPLGFEEQRGPPADPRLGGAEDEEQEDRREQGGAQGHDDDLAADVVELAEDRRRVPPDGDHRDHVLADLEWEVLAQDVAADGQGIERFGAVRGDDHAGDLTVQRRLEGDRRRGEPSGGAGAREEERAVRQAELDAEVVGACVERGEVRLEGRDAIRRDVARQVGR